ncbi:MAG: P1 family peptidase [Sulfitobacter sp.]
MQAGPKNLITDVAGVLVGNAQDNALKSGSTVVTAEKAFCASVHVMGGAPGTRETDLLAPDKAVAEVDALVLSGGSAFGLDACSGVVDGLHAAGRGFKVGKATVPLVPGAILFDLLNGGEKNWQENPYRALGTSAFANASDHFTLGTVGAGTGALTGMMKGGLGSASLVLPDGSTVGALVATNPVGNVTTPSDRYFFAAPFELDNEFGGLGTDPASGLGLSLDSRKVEAMSVRENTTIAIIATDASLTKAECQRVAVAAHDGIGRATVPAHMPQDGDLVFAMTTAAKPAGHVGLIGHAAALCLSRAIARAVYEAIPAPNDLLPTWGMLNA